ncbi:retrotransposon protein, putative, ty1-copia subclass [Tanacetum coccineum]
MTHNMGKTIPELHAMLKLAENSTLKKAPAVLAIRQGQIQKPKSQAHGKGKKKGKGKIKTGHWKRNCPLYLAKLKKNKTSTSGTLGIFTIELLSFPKSNSWIYDIGCGTHICNTIQGLRGYQKLNKGDLDLYVGNGNSADVEATGSFDIILLSEMILKHIEKLQQDGLLKSIDDESFDVCVSCISGKMERKPFNHASERANDLLGIIHSDIYRPFRTTPREGANYYVTFTNDFSRYGYVYLIKHKHEVFEMFKTFKKEVENQLGNTIKALRSDRGGEYLSQEFLDHLRIRWIISQLPYTPQYNGVSERRNQTLLDMVRSIMSLTTLPMSFWGYALESAARILNMVPIKKVNKTPYKTWHGKVSNLSYLKTSLISQEASGSTVDFDEIQRQDAQPSKTTSQHQPVVEQDDVDPQTDEHELGDHGEPPNYRVALLDPKSKKWLEAMNAEMQSMKDNQVWNLVDLPPNCKTVGSKWLFKKKTNMDRNIHTYKARLVAKGFTQTYEVDYDETFSPVADIKDIKILIEIAAYYDYDIWQMDVKTAFLNGHLNEDIYMGFVNPKHPRRVCKLQRSIYGFKQASRS